jgi:hypothetical protein
MRAHRVCFNVLQASIAAAVNMDVVSPPRPVPPIPVRMPVLAVLVATGTRPAARVQLTAPVLPAAAALMPPLQIAPLQPVHLPGAAGCHGFMCNWEWDLAKLFEPNGQVYPNYDMRSSPLGTRHTMHRLCHDSRAPFF